MCLQTEFDYYRSIPFTHNLRHSQIRRIIYTTNSVEGYHRQLRKVTKTKSSFPAPEAARKLLYLATMDITRKWTAPIRDWALVLNQLVIRFEDRIAI